MNILTDRRISIFSKSRTKESAYGSATITRVLLAVVWAERRDAPPGRAESMRQGLEQARNAVRYRFRYRSDVDSSMEIHDGDQVLQIVGGPAEIGRREWLEVTCELIVPGVA